MTPMLKKLSNLFSGSKNKEKQETEIRRDKAARIAEEIRAKEAATPKENPDAPAPQASMTPPPEEAMPDHRPLQRTIIQAPIIVEQKKGEEQDDAEIRIKAEPSREGESCKFMVNKSLFEGHSWFFSSFESAAGSPLAEKVFSQDEVESLLIHDSTAVVTRKEKGHFDWKPMATQIGAMIRETINEGQGTVGKNILDEMPSQDTIREEIQKVIDTEVNPGVAGHGGNITLQQVEGNTVTIQMGGGCQGCSAADLTLKQGIHGAFRKSVPFVGAIYDETDHAAGQNPYFS